MKISYEFFLYFFFLIFVQNIDCGYTLEPPRRGASNEYQQSMFWSKNKKIGIPLSTLFSICKSGVQGGIPFTDMFFSDVRCLLYFLLFGQCHQ